MGKSENFTGYINRSGTRKSTKKILFWNLSVILPFEPPYSTFYSESPHRIIHSLIVFSKYKQGDFVPQKLFFLCVAFWPITDQPSYPSGAPVTDCYFAALHNDGNLPGAAGVCKHLL
jgi:hypothetical protein